MTTLDLSSALFMGAPYGQYDGTGIITTGSSWPDFMFAGLQFDPNMQYDFVATYDASYATTVGQFYVYGAAGADDADYGASPFNAFYTGSTDQAVHTFTIGPGSPWFNSELAAGRSFPIFESDPACRLISLTYTATPYVTAAGDWIPPKLLSDPDPSASDSDGDGFVEGQMCILDNGIVVVMALSSYSYAIHAWAVDISGPTPVVGPEAYFNSDGNSWASIPDDPKGEVIGDLGMICALSDTTFAMVGESEGMDASGDARASVQDYGHIASLFAVDPDTLAITRTSIVTGLWSADDVPSSDNSISRWGNKAVIVSAEHFIPPRVWIVNPDGTHSTIVLSTDGYNAGCVVAGDSAYFLNSSSGVAGSYHLLEVELPGGAVTDHGEASTFDNVIYSWFGVPLSDTKIAYSLVTDETSDIGTLQLATFNPTLSGPFIIATGARDVGWTGGYYSNAVSISPMPDGSLLMGWFDGEMRWASVQEDGTILDTGQVANFTAPINYLWYCQAAATPDGRKVALFSASNYPGIFGVYLSYTAPQASVISGVIGSPRTRFIP